MSDTIHRMVTERMIAALERGTVPWHKPWHAADGRPTSMTTGQPYRGVNLFLLGLTATEEGYRSRYWGTYQQITQLGGQVRRGEHSTLVVLWKPVEVADRDAQPDEVTVKQVPVLRYYRVFNAAQADHLPQRFYPTLEEDAQIREPQAVLDGYLAHARPTNRPPTRSSYRFDRSSGQRRSTTPPPSTRPPIPPATRPGWTVPASPPSTTSAPTSTHGRNWSPR